MQTETIILAHLSQLQTKVDLLINGKPKPVVSPEEAMPLTGCRSLRAQFRWFKRHNVKPYERGQYRRIDITNRVAALGIEANTSRV